VTLVGKLNKRPGRVLGIDSNTKSIALAIYKEDQLEYFGKINLKGSDLYERVRMAGLASRAITKKWEISHVAIESAVFVNSVQVGIKMAMIEGAIISGLMFSGKTTVLEVPPRSWQQYIGNVTYNKEMKAVVAEEHPGKSASWLSGEIRNRRKQFTMDYFNDKFNVNIADDDIGDACGIGWYAVNKMIDN